MNLATLISNRISAQRYSGTGRTSPVSDSRKFATTSNAQATTKIHHSMIKKGHSVDVPSVTKAHPAYYVT
jgi:hypothetical protein